MNQNCPWSLSKPFGTLFWTCFWLFLDLFLALFEADLVGPTGKIGLLAYVPKMYLLLDPILDPILDPFWMATWPDHWDLCWVWSQKDPKTLFLGAITVHFGYKSGTFVYTKFNVRIWRFLVSILGPKISFPNTRKMNRPQLHSGRIPQDAYIATYQAY